MKTLIIIGVILVVVGLLTTRLLTKRFSINQKENIMSKKHKRIQFIGVTILFFAFMVASFVLMIKNPDINILFILIPFLVSISALRIFMEWRYNRKANRWILEIFSTLFILMAYLMINWVMPTALAYS